MNSLFTVHQFSTIFHQFSANFQLSSQMFCAIHLLSSWSICLLHSGISLVLLSFLHYGQLYQFSFTSSCWILHIWLLMCHTPYGCYSCHLHLFLYVATFSMMSLLWLSQIHASLDCIVLPFWSLQCHLWLNLFCLLYKVFIFPWRFSWILF